MVRLAGRPTVLTARIQRDLGAARADPRPMLLIMQSGARYGQHAHRAGPGSRASQVNEPVLSGRVTRPQHHDQANDPRYADPQEAQQQRAGRLRRIASQRNPAPGGADNWPSFAPGWRRAGAARRAMRCVPCWPVNTQTLCRAARLLGARLGVPTGGTSTTCKYGNSHSPADRSHEPGDDTAASVTHSGEREFAPVGRLKGPERRLSPRSCQQPAPAEDTDPNTRAATHRAAVAVLCCCTYCSNRSNYASDQWS